ncbi:DUF1444 family protein [Candidatus Peregrinibacteria bacterium]|nr:DUF1444 family protein [Candidatus Peregrinibacteria bacterium]
MNIHLKSITLLSLTCVLLTSCSHKPQTPWEAVQDSILPQLIPAENKTKVPLVVKPFLPDVDIGFVVDEETTYTFVDPGNLEEWSIDQDTLMETAMENLEDRSEDLNIEVAEAGEGKEETYVIVEVDDGYSAVRLLSAAVRNAVSRELGDEFIAAVPTRDFLIFWHPSFSLGVQFTNQVRTEYDAEEKYKLSPELILVTPEGMQQLKVEGQ